MRRSLSSSFSSLSSLLSSSIIKKLSPFHFSSVASSSETSNSSSFLIDYLINTFGFTKSQADTASKRFSYAKGPEKPVSVVRYLQELGFSDTHIRQAIVVTPQILFSDIEKTLKPKLNLLQELGFTGSDLGRFVSKNTTILTSSLNKKLLPCISILKEILSVDGNNGRDGKDLIRVLQRCQWIITKNPEVRLLPNISILRSYGIIGSQLSMLLKRQPVVFVKTESQLRELIKKTEGMGFSSDSRMFVHAVYTLSCISSETLQKKFNLFRSYGFTEEECLVMFRSMPGLVRTSVDKLKLGIEFFMNIIGCERVSLVRQPTCLMNSMEKRVIPRYQVLEVLKSKKLLKKNPCFLNLIQLPEDEFLEKYISKFSDNAEELLIAYKGELLNNVED